MLAPAHGMREAIDAITKCPAATRAKTPEEAKRKRVEAAPACLKGRVEEDEVLPVVEVRRGGQGEELQAVVAHVVWELKSELVVELMGFLRPKWSEGKATWEGLDQETEEEEEEREEEDMASDYGLFLPIWRWLFWW